MISKQKGFFHQQSHSTASALPQYAQHAPSSNLCHSALQTTTRQGRPALTGSGNKGRRSETIPQATETSRQPGRQKVSLSTFIRPSTSLAYADSNAPWLLLLFIPAAFSFVCPTEVLAFQSCYEEFHERHCSIAFVSVDTKHSLWHWQSVPRQYGGLGNIDIPLLSDATHKIGRDYGVLVEEEGVSLRGMFIIDGEGLVQQITLNNLSVGRSVLEALRLLEAFQAVAKHGVLCPIDWKPNSQASDTLNTISNTLVESYEDRLANLQKGQRKRFVMVPCRANDAAEFGDVQVTDLDAKHKTRNSTESVPHADFVEARGPKVSISSTDSSNGASQVTPTAQDPPSSPGHTNCTPRVLPPTPQRSIEEEINNVKKSPPSPITAVATPIATPSTQDPPPLKLQSQERTARHSRGHHSTHHSQSAHSYSPRRPQHLAPGPNTYESQGGSYVVLEFADPISSPMEERAGAESRNELERGVEARGQQLFGAAALDAVGQQWYDQPEPDKTAGYVPGNQEDQCRAE
ncbi:hypothetical protein OPT61_g5733 [Boeremia exigua]|uniref:Uncharacterized protein n=1 Tax=Boeremia exigua TaxID=749465 RepID=A0ACC2I9C2_9PLEO|nr:hypothetical protein OPT61_g5733 [Boeremia exigua]